MTFQEILDDLAGAAETVKEDCIAGFHTAESAVAVLAPVAKTIMSVLSMINCFKSTGAKAAFAEAGNVLNTAESVAATAETILGDAPPAP